MASPTTPTQRRRYANQNERETDEDGAGHTGRAHDAEREAIAQTALLHALDFAGTCMYEVAEVFERPTTIPGFGILPANPNKVADLPACGDDIIRVAVDFANAPDLRLLQQHVRTRRRPDDMVASPNGLRRPPLRNAIRAGWRALRGRRLKSRKQFTH